MALAGKKLAGIGPSGTATYVAASATQHSWPFWPYWVFTGMLVAGAVLYYAGRRRPPARDKDNRPGRAARPRRDWLGRGWLAGARRAQTVAGWHVLTGAGSADLARTARRAFSHARCPRPGSGTGPPSVCIVISVAIGPLGSTPTTADLRDFLLGFLRGPAVSRLLRSLTDTGGDLAWRLHDGDGRLRIEAVLAGREHERKSPAAVTVMMISEDAAARGGHGPQTAELVLHIEPRDDQGDPAPPASFGAWYETLVRALVVPGAFAQFLRHDVDVMTYDDPPVQVAVQFQAGHDLSELIDTGGIRPLPGSRPSNIFLDCMTAGPGGRAADDAVAGMLIRVCDHALHLENTYEDALAKLRQGR
jgi:hypothetical protein